MNNFSPKPSVFVLMPFSRDFDDVYQLGIKPACERAGTYAQRVDEQVFEGSILQRIFNQIAKADLVVADMSRRNPNVFYETGYAHALGKSVILLTQAVDDIPFDLKHYPHIVYSRVIDVIPELERRIRALLQAPAAAQRPRLLDLSVNGVRIEDNAVVAVELRNVARSIELTLHLFNSIARGVAVVQGQVGFVTAPTLDCIYVEVKGHRNRLTPHLLPDGRHLFLHPEPIEILPGAFKELFFSPISEKEPLIKRGSEFPTAVRFLTATGYEDHAFTVTVTFSTSNG